MATGVREQPHLSQQNRSGKIHYLEIKRSSYSSLYFNIEFHTRVITFILGLSYDLGRSLKLAKFKLDLKTFSFQKLSGMTY